MPKGRDTYTDRLSNVIEVAELGRRTGLLTAERGTPSYAEEGDVFFVNGRAIYAATGQLRGRDALAALSQWGSCRFAFITEATPPPANIQPNTGHNSASFERNTATPARTPAVSWGTPAQADGGSGGWDVATNTAPRGLPTADDFSTSGTWGGSAPGGASMGPLGRRPRRSPDVRDLMSVVTTHNLSRSHRTILLLADGSHNVLDLARLASKTVDDVTQMLAELEAHGLIYYYE
ncbi:MAG TPA: DUF4388 domain-containing protein [Ktedonobacterales bacterium]|nr:DUF4388 domain-containing protein [Ktedonobacterales bacterium]